MYTLWQHGFKIHHAYYTKNVKVQLGVTIRYNLWMLSCSVTADMAVRCTKMVQSLLSCIDRANIGIPLFLGKQPRLDLAVYASFCLSFTPKNQLSTI